MVVNDNGNSGGRVSVEHEDTVVITVNVHGKDDPPEVVLPYLTGHITAEEDTFRWLEGLGLRDSDVRLAAAIEVQMAASTGEIYFAQCPPSVVVMPTKLLLSQAVTLSASFFFTLSLSGVDSEAIQHDATAQQMEAALVEIAPPDLIVSVARSANVFGVSAVGFVWHVTFFSSGGAMPKIMPSLTIGSAYSGEPGTLSISPVAHSLNIRGLFSDISLLLASTIYRGAKDLNSMVDGHDEIAISVEDDTGIHNTTLLIHTMPVNDAPIIVGPSSFSTLEDTDCQLAGGELTIVDVDVKETLGAMLTVHLSSSFGRLSLPTRTGLHLLGTEASVLQQGGAASVIKFKGAVEHVNLALSSVTYHPSLHWNSLNGGVGVAEVQTLCTHADTAMEVLTIVTSLHSGSLAGSFTLVVEKSIQNYSSTLAHDSMVVKSSSETLPINFDANEIDVVSALQELPIWPADVIPRVRKSPLSLQNTTTWEVSFFNKKWGRTFKMSIGTKALTGGRGEHKPDVVLNVLRTGHNSIGGIFGVRLQDSSIVKIPYDASESLLKKSLESLAPHIGVVEVSRTHVNSLRRSYCWAVTFLPTSNASHVGDLDSLEVDASGLLGFGADVTVKETRPGVLTFDTASF